LFILPVASRSGGANVVLTESRVLRSWGIDVWIANLRCSQREFSSILTEDDPPIIFVEDFSRLVALATEFDAVVATAWTSTEALRSLSRLKRHPALGYYIQDYEPYFYPIDSADRERARRSYHFPERGRVALFTKTLWNQREVLRHEGIAPEIVGASIDNSTFHSKGRIGSDQHVRVCAMVRPETLRRSPELTMRVLKQLKMQFGNTVQISVFGYTVDEPGSEILEMDFEHEHLGILDSRSIAQLMRRCDIFMDFSAFQAMGLTAMEAMACGTVVLGPKNGGLGEILNHGASGLLVNTDDAAECLAAAASLIADPQLLDSLRRGIPDMNQYSPDKAASHIARLLLIESQSGNITFLSAA
jgi:glycosyltransferase involved in cell wall biosynthesis